MKKYVIAIEETVASEFEVEAESAEEAMILAKRKYDDLEFVLEPGELCARQMAVISPDGHTGEWVGF